MEGNLCSIVSKIYVAITRTCQGAATKIKINVRTYPFEKKYNQNTGLSPGLHKRKYMTKCYKYLLFNDISLVTVYVFENNVIIIMTSVD
jgi:hypothetical protein